MARLLITFLLFTALLPANAAAQAVQYSAPPSKRAASKPADSLRQSIEAVLSSPGAWRGHWGIKIVSADSGKTLHSLNERKYFTPASNTKLFTTALALATLGPQFRFRTTVETDTAPDAQGRVAGDLLLVGRGDPNLSSRVFPYKVKTERDGPPLQALDKLADQVVERGVRYVDGDIVGDDIYFVYERYGDGWAHDDLVWSYGAPVSALAINDNFLFLDILPGSKPGDRAIVRLEPYPADLRIENRVVTVEARGRRPAPGGAGNGPDPFARRILVHREPGSQTLHLWGRIPIGDSGAREQVAMEDPALLAAQYLRGALVARGVIVHGRARGQHSFPFEFEDLKTGAPAPLPFREDRQPAAEAKSTRHLLAQYESRPLAENLRVINKESQNLHAEMMLRIVARERRGIGSVAAGLEEMKAFLERAGVPEDEYAFYDGSGLSRRNLVTPAATVALLEYMDRQEFRDTWRDLMPVAGVDGTIRERFKEPPASGALFAKTGTLSHVNALSGYATSAKGERLVFSIIINHHSLRGRAATQLIDRICQAMIEGH